ncbi:MAR-binding filament-like protein 1 [Nicotiana sylvestris]|uniref:MAR-binding filament-like protein 1 n=1 Tax=Nicotiana sylvestris TaxID=4096 RepID=UPI00388C7AC8
MAEDSELWDIICDSPHVPMKKLQETGPMVPKRRKEYNDIDRKAIEKNYRAKKILMCAIRPDEYNKVSTCDTAKEIWEALQTSHKGTTQSDDDDEEDEDDEINFRDVQRNLKSYSSKKLRSLSNVLVDAYYSLINDKEILTIELGEAEQSKDDLVVCVVDLNETIANLEKEKETLNERITSVENERDDLMVVVVHLKETIEGLNNEKHTLEEKVTSTKEERDDLLVICTDLEETIEGLNREHRNISLGKGKEVASETHIMLEKELTIVKTSLCSELERNQQLQAELEKVRNDLEKYLRWT